MTGAMLAVLFIYLATPSAPAARLLDVGVVSAPTKIETTVIVPVTVLQESPAAGDGAERLLVFKPTPLVRRLSVQQGVGCARWDDGFRLAWRPDGSKAQPVTIGLAITTAPGTAGRLLLGQVAFGDGDVAADAFVEFLDDYVAPESVGTAPVLSTCGDVAAPGLELVGDFEEAPPSSEPLRTCLAQKPFRVLLDPGHGPDGRPGAKSSRGRDEYQYNDALAAETRKLLSSYRGLAVELTRSPAEARTLKERVALANARKPDLMVSLHHDSVSWDLRTQRRVGRRSVSSCDDYYGFSIYVDTVNEYAELSYRAARHLSDRLLASSRPIGRFFFWGEIQHGIYNGDLLYVLRNAKVPAFLFEAGFICNYEDEQRVMDPQFRRQTAQQIANAILAFAGETHCAR